MQPAQMNNTSWIVLGLLRVSGDKTGYELKQLIDRTTQYFWPASYGRIYPELRRLTEQGLITGVEDSRGGRRRRRYALTDAGRAILEQWLGQPGELIYELRDEAVLRLFLGAAARPQDQLATVRAMRELHADYVRRLQAIGENVLPEAFPDPTIPQIMLEGGLGLHRWYLAWCDELERLLVADGEA